MDQEVGDREVTGRTVRRRSLLGMGMAAFAGAAAAGALRGTAEGAPANLRTETFNQATSNTTLRADIGGTTWRVTNKGASTGRRNAMYGYVGPLGTDVPALAQDTAVVGHNDVNAQRSTGVLGISTGDSGVGVLGLNDRPGGFGVRAQSANGTALHVLGASAFVGAAAFDGVVSATGFFGNGANLTNLNASQLTTGTVPDSRLSINVAKKHANQNVFRGAIRAASLSSRTLAVTGTARVGTLNVEEIGGSRSNLAPNFTSSGRVVVRRGQLGVTVNSRLYNDGAMVLATVQGDPGTEEPDVGVKYVVSTGPNQFRIVLTAAPARDVAVGFLILR